MALIPTDRLPKAQTGIIEAQKKAQESIQVNPFGNMSLNKLQVEQDPTYGNYNQPQQRVVQQQPIQQTRVAQQPTVQRQPAQPKATAPKRTVPIKRYNENTGSTAGKELRKTPNGNKYYYKDVYDHSNDIELDSKATAKLLLRLPQSYKSRLEVVAERERTSLNQVILRAIKEFIR